MNTVTIKSDLCINGNQIKTVTFLRDGSSVASIDVAFDEGFQWAAEYACVWCSYGRLPKTSTPVDIAPPASFIGSVLWNRHDVGWWPNWIPFDERGPVTEIHDASELLRDAGVVAPIDGLVYCVCKLPTCTIGICMFGDTGYEFQIPFMSTGVDIAPPALPDPPSEIWVSADLIPTPTQP